MFVSPRYRFLTQKYNFDDYSSKGSAVHAAKKFHRALAGGSVMGDETSTDPTVARALLAGRI